jgi:ABC-type lipoprotein export system ATPase subunit
VWADEPTGNLDSESTAAIMALITRLNSAGQTIVMVTHSPLTAAAAARTVRMRDGRIDGEPAGAWAVPAGSTQLPVPGQAAGATTR